MIVPMKKVSVIVQQKDAATCVSALGLLGVFHVEHQKPPQGKDINALQEELATVTAVLGALSEKRLGNNNAALEDEKLTDWNFSAKHIIDLGKRLEHLEHFSHNLLNSIQEWQKWEDFDPAKIEALADKNIHIRLYQIPLKELHLLPETVTVKKISVSSGIANCAVISYGAADIPFKETALPKAGLSELQARYAQDMQTIQSLRQELYSLRKYRKEFSGVKKSLESQLEFQQAIRGMGEARGLSYITGYVPFDRAVQVLETAKQEKWGLVAADPFPEDNVPTLIRNPGWISLIKPVFQLLEVVPGYRELDISPLFLLFLALFFGMIIGDAGYGAVYCILTFLAQRKYRGAAKDKTVFFLFYLFSACAIGWGILTGTVFGQRWYLEAGFNPLAPALNDTKVIMAFCFFIGALQLSLAHGWQALTKLPSLSALADIGFICLLWVGFLLAKMFILGELFPDIGKWLAAAGMILIVLFVSPQKNFLKTIGAGLGTLALGIMGNFGDVVSYIRLFAVGLAGVAVSDSVNILAGGLSGNIAAQVLILFAGHSINIMLGPMSVLVHGIRLNVLEFSLLHGNITWSGTAYKPLKA